MLRGVWISRSTEIFSEHAIDENRSYKQGFYFDFTAGEMSEVRIYHELNGSDLRPVAMSVPATGSAIRISQPVTSGIYAGWHLVQWETERDRCATIAVGLERRRDELVDTLMVIGPKMFWSSNSDSTRSIEDFFKDPTNRRRDFLNYGMNPLPKWK